jgi:hypothetical protein
MIVRVTHIRLTQVRIMHVRVMHACKDNASNGMDCQVNACKGKVYTGNLCKGKAPKGKASEIPFSCRNCKIRYLRWSLVCVIPIK